MKIFAMTMEVTARMALFTAVKMMNVYYISQSQWTRTTSQATKHP